MACGHNCWGILWAPVTGKIVSELVVDGKSSIDLSGVRPWAVHDDGAEAGEEDQGCERRGAVVTTDEMRCLAKR